MLATRVLFYKLADMAIDAFFNRIFRNFGKLEDVGEYQIHLSNLKVGDKFKQLSVQYSSGDYVTYYDVIVRQVIEGDVLIEYLYKYIHNTEDGSMFYTGYLSDSTLPNDILDMVREDDTDYIESDDAFYINYNKFKQIEIRLIPFMISADDWIIEDMYVDKIKVLT